MDRLLTWIIQNPIAANLLMVTIVCGGLLTWPVLPRDVFPQVPPSTISISTSYPGASPRDVDAAICLPIDAAIADIEGIKNRYSQATDGHCWLSLLIKDGYPLNDVLETVRDRTGNMNDLPDKAEQSVVEIGSQNQFSIGVVIYGTRDPIELHTLAEKTAQELRNLPSVDKVSTGFQTSRTINISISRSILQQYNLNVEEVIQQLRTESVDIPAGTLTSNHGEVKIRVRNQRRTIPELREVVLRNGPDGSNLSLGQVASINDRSSNSGSVQSWFNGKPAAQLYIYAGRQHNILKLTEAVKEYVDSV